MNTEIKSKIKSKKKEEKSYWVYLHPYVYVSVKSNHAILYNTLSGELLEYRDNKAVLNLIKRLDSDSGLYVVKFYESGIDSEIDRFIRQIRGHYMGDRLDTTLRPHRPFQMKPMLNLQETFDYLITGDSSGKLLVNDEIQDYLGEITLYINTRCRQSCTHCESAYKQYLCCRKNNGGAQEMKIETIAALIEEIKSSACRKFTITGGNLFLYPELRELVQLLDRVPVIKEYSIHYLNMEDNRRFFEPLQKEQNQLNATIHFPINREKLDNSMKILGQYHLNKCFRFVIEEEEHIKEAEDIISRFNIETYDYVPHYNGANYVFFKENVFLDRQSILETKPSMQDIFTRKTLNSRDFKRLTVLSNGDIYANVNHPKLGKLGREPVYEMIFREQQRGKSWSKVRKNITPCKSCVYNGLCPPISNYEYVIGKYNLCNII